MSELFIEILSADTPAGMQKNAIDQFTKAMVNALADAEIPFEQGACHSTPRRMIFVAENIPATIADKVEEKKGPKVGAPQQALDGFLRSNNLTQNDLVEKETPKGNFWFAHLTKKGGATKDLLKEIIPAAMRSINWPKSMRWGESAFRWARPLRNIVALLDGEVIEFTFDLGGQESPLTSTNKTVGHRFLSPDEIEVKNYEDYKSKMHSAYVMIDRDERKKIIVEEANLMAKQSNGQLHEDPALIEEIVGLIEWPVMLKGQFDKDFLEVPQECLIKTMKKDQKYIPILDKNGHLTHEFVITSNMVTDDQGKTIIAGNQKVLRARLSDARFFYEQDLKTTLDDRLPQLENIKFHEKLGTVHARVKRLEELSGMIAKITGTDTKQAIRAAELSKSDLVTGMVGEFADLQGIMGRYYAKAAGETDAVSHAIEDHYKPAGPEDKCPTEPISICLALADKIDVLTGFFAINEKPTGSKDPFALRRAALGIIRLVLENNLTLDLKALFEASQKAYSSFITIENDTLIDDLLNFVADRMKVSLKDQGVRHDLIDAVFGLGLNGNLTRVVARVSALQNFLSTEDGKNLVAGYKRANNIVSIEEKKDKISYDATVTPNLFTQEEETKLHDVLSQAEVKIKPSLENENYEDVMSEMADLRAPIDAFFEKVTVNDNDPSLRQNRLNMLAKIRSTLNQVADFSKVNDA